MGQKLLRKRDGLALLVAGVIHGSSYTNHTGNGYVESALNLAAIDLSANFSSVTFYLYNLKQIILSPWPQGLSLSV